MQILPQSLTMINSSCQLHHYDNKCLSIYFSLGDDYTLEVCDIVPLDSFSNALSPAKLLPLPTNKLIASGYFLRHKIVNACGIDVTGNESKVSESEVHYHYRKVEVDEIFFLCF